MNPLRKWVYLTVFLMAFALVGWYLGFGLWAGLTYYQLNLLTGQGVICAGVAVLLWEVEKRWYD